MRLVYIFLISFCVSATMTSLFLHFARADTPIAMTLLRKTTVMVNGASCSGSGSIVQSKSGHKYILTNAHVCNCARYKGELFATFEGGELLKAKVVKQDWSKDLCVARTDDSRPALQLALGFLPNTEVNTRGYPEGRLTESHGQSNVRISWDAEFPIEEVGTCPSNSAKLVGYNGNLVGCQIHFTSISTNLFARPGSSGSPVTNDNGELVGVLSSWYPEQDFDAGMVPYSDVKAFLGDL